MNTAPASWKALQPHYDAHGALQVRDLPASSELVGTPRMSLLLLRTQDNETVFGIPANLQIPANSPLLPALEDAPVQDGWRLVASVPGTDLGTAWEAYERLFVDEPGGEEDAPPQLPQGAARPARRDDQPAPPFCADLVQAAESNAIPRAIGRDAEVTQLIEALGGRLKRSACLVGDPGVGKTALVEELAHRVAEEQVPEHLKAARIWQLSLAELLGGAAQHGDVEQRVANLAGTLMETRPGQAQPVLFLDELHAATGARGDLTIAELLKPHLARGLRVIGATTYADWARCLEPDRALVRRFQRINVVAPDLETTVRILTARLPELEAHHGLTVEPEVLRQVVELSDRWLWGRAQPDKALELLDAALSHQALELQGTASPVTQAPAAL